MKKIQKVCLFATAALLSLSGCSEEDALNGSGAEDLPQAMTFTASYSGEESTRATLNGTSETFDAGDSISILSTRNANVRFVTTNGGKSANFTGSAKSDSRYYAIYPFSSSLSLSAYGSTISGLTIPTSQWNSNWTEGNMSAWDPSAPLAYAVASSNNNLVFNNVCAILKITIPTTDNNVTITIGADQKMAGSCSLLNGNLTIDPTNGSNVVTVGNSTNKVKGGSIVYVAIAPGRYTNFYVSAHNGRKENRKNKADITFAANVIHNLGSFFIDSPMYGSHDYVDLGLPSGTLWATCNVGASKPEDYGNYYAWGETATKSTYDWSTYKWCRGSYGTMTKYCTDSSYGTVDNKTVLDPEDDAAHVNWGGDWRMPTADEIDELNNENYCTWTWITQNGVNGYKVTSVSNGNSIFLPAAGFRDGSSLNVAGSYGYYWSSSLYSDYSNGAYYMCFYSGGHNWSYFYRLYGFPVRPVLGSAQNSQP